jgi:hypothetical protein
LGCHAIENDLDDVIFNAVALNIPKWHMLKLARYLQNLHQSMWGHGILGADTS